MVINFNYLSTDLNFNFFNSFLRDTNANGAENILPITIQINKP